jgi:hypothetical protein
VEHFLITKTAQGFDIEAFPDAIKVLRIRGPNGQRLAGLALHRSDLDFAFESLNAINDVPPEPSVLREALWRSAVVHFVKCFGRSRSRFTLNPKDVYKGDPGAYAAFEYFRSLRNKHLAHDENSYAQCHPGAVLNKKGKDHKIAKILCPRVIAETLNQENYNNLRVLVTHAREWLMVQFDELCDLVASGLEVKSHAVLSAMDGIAYKAPGADDVRKPRAAL